MVLIVRSLLFNIFFPAWTFSLAIVLLPLLLLPQNIAQYAGKIWAIGVILGLRVICNIKYEVKGVENIPNKPFIVASKHQSAWDTAIFLKILHNPAYILKKELLNVPFFGFHLRSMAMVPIDRSGGSSALKDMIKHIKNRLKKGRSIIIFPEGTRTSPGDPPKYHPGVAFIYMDKEITVPVIPVALNSGEYWGKHSFIKKPGTIVLEYLPQIKKGLNRKEFLKTLEVTIEKSG